eukprot:1154925-Pelagomonas_calceolata.AAC.14
MREQNKCAVLGLFFMRAVSGRKPLLPYPPAAMLGNGVERTMQTGKQNAVVNSSTAEAAVYD